MSTSEVSTELAVTNIEPKEIAKNASPEDTEDVEYSGSSSDSEDFDFEKMDREFLEQELDHLSRLVDSQEKDGSGGSFPKTNLVIRLSPTIQPEAIKWLVQKITGKKQDGGGELLVRCEPFYGNQRDSIVLHVTASKLKFLECAEYLELKKLDTTGVLREFNVADLDQFLHGSISLDNLLSPAEKQLVVTHELDNIRTLVTDTIVPGYPETELLLGQSVFNVYVQQELILDVFPLHDDSDVERLGQQWYYALFTAQPFDEIRRYFGDAIALYFSFLGFYTVSLIAPAAFGIVQFFLSETTSGNSTVFFCVFNLIWVTITQELWKRKCSEQAYTWGTLRMTKMEDPRANYRGVMTIDPVTGRYQPHSPGWHTTVKVYCVSYPVVGVSLICATWIMLYSIWLEEYLTEAKQRHGSELAGYLTMVPSIAYAAFVWIVNNSYRKFATKLTEWENHRTQSQFDYHRITKLVLFEFVNTFMSLFYLAFYIQDFEMLKSQVTVMLIAIQFINHFQEALLPLVLRRGYNFGKTWLIENHPALAAKVGFVYEKVPGEDTSEGTGTEVSAFSSKTLGLQILDSKDPRIEAAKQQSDMDAYEGTFDDYLEMFIQFGYVFLFSAVSPLAAVYAIINNVIEIRADAFKLCKVSQRPLAKRVRDIGVWQTSFELLGVMAVSTNCALLCLSPNLRSLAPTMSSAEWLLLFIFIEHLLICIKLGLAQIIPDIPSWVKLALASVEYRSRQALKKEQTYKARRHLTRRFKTIHVAGKKCQEGKNSGTEVLGLPSTGTSHRRRHAKKSNSQANNTQIPT